MKKAAVCFFANGAILSLLVAGAASGAIDFPVTFNDPGGTQAAYYGSLTSNIQAAGKQWARFLGGNGSIEVEVAFSNAVQYAPGGSVTTGFVRNNGTRDIFEQGAIYELRTGTDVNGAMPDIRITINPDYLTTNLWFDPNPTKRTDVIPANRTDAVSVFVHELGHAFVFNGWMNGTTGQLPATYMSTFDEHVVFDGTDFYFTGNNAKAGYGGKNVPITFGVPFHLGNNAPRPGADLIPDLMNGVVFTYQVRYRISVLDLKIVKDCGGTVNDLNLTITSVTRLANNGHMVISGKGEASAFVRIDAASSPGGTPGQIGTASTDATGAFQFEDTASDSVTSRYYSASYP
jgi:hypothetical protein